MKIQMQTNGIDFERHHPLVRVLRLPLIWFLGMLPSAISHKLFISWSDDAAKASHWAKSYKAMEVMYTFPERRRAGKASWGDIFWETILSNARSIRNRLLLTEKLIKDRINDFSKEKVPVRILSLGCGSGRSLLETVASLNSTISVNATFLDRSHNAIRCSKELARTVVKNGRHNELHWVCKKTEEFPAFLSEFSPHIVEMVGLLDYFSDLEVVDLFQLIHRSLSLGGWFLVSNIIPNAESPFVTKGIKWPLIHRTPEQLGRLLSESGFPEDEVTVFVEPLMVHAIGVGRKI